VLYEWRRGRRVEAELAIESVLLGPDTIVDFGENEARLAAEMYRKVKHPRKRELDIAIAACAVSRSAQFWTLNPKDFQDIPGLELHRP
jgi:predicted nucleic acid-binding protein